MSETTGGNGSVAAGTGAPEPERYDSVVVGTGQAGKPLAHALAKAGHHTAIVEMDRVGGTCVIDGCSPSKTMIASARVAHLCARAAEYGVRTGPAEIVMERVLARKREIVDSFSESGERALREREGLRLLHGRARFRDARTLVVEPTNGGPTRTIAADRIFLDVGGRPTVPPIEGLDEVDFLDSTSLMELAEVPDHLVVVGGGAIGVELGQMHRRFGAQVTIVEQEPRLLASEDDDVSEALGKILEGEGLTILVDAEIVRVKPEARGVRVSVRTPEGIAEVVGSHLLVAVGRTPNSDLLDVEKAGIELDERGFIPVDEHCRTGVDGVWAMGDVTGAPPFTHVAYDDFRVVASSVLGDRPERTRDRMTPYTVFTDPELARVGLDERTARKRGIDYRLAELPMKSVARALETDETRGFMKCLVDPRTDRILGGTILSAHGGEIMSVLQVAMMGGVPASEMRDAVIAHPTWAEALQKLFETLDRT